MPAASAKAHPPGTFLRLAKPDKLRSRKRRTSPKLIQKFIRRVLNNYSGIGLTAAARQFF